MKKLKLTNVLAMFIMLFGLMITQNSCKDPCKDVECKNAGTCVEGVCECAAGYEGDDCGTLMTAKFVGQYQGNEQCSVGTDSYVLTVEASASDVMKLTLTNVYNAGYTASATFSGSSFTVASQTVAANVTLEGSGNVSGDAITFTYTIVGTTSNSCTFTGNKL